MATYGQTLLSKCAVLGRSLSTDELANLQGDELIQYASLGYELSPTDVERLGDKLLPRYEAMRKAQAGATRKSRPR